MRLLSAVDVDVGFNWFVTLNFLVLKQLSRTIVPSMHSEELKRVRSSATQE